MWEVVKTQVLGHSEPTQVLEGLKHSSLHFRRGDLIYSEGQTASGIYWLKSGQVSLTESSTRVSRTSLDRRILRLVGQREFFGFSAYFLGHPHAHSAKALSDVSIWLFEESSQDLKALVLHQSLTELEALQTKNSQFYMSSVKDRVQALLMELSQRFGRPSPEGVEINVPLSRKEMAQLAGTIDETLVRHLSELRKAGLIETRGKKILLKESFVRQSLESNEAPLGPHV